MAPFTLTLPLPSSCLLIPTRRGWRAKARTGPGVLRPGERLGDYRIIEELGRGAMGEVYLAEQVHLEQKYALKVLPRGLSKRGNFRERFRREAKTLAKLKHNQIVQVLYAGEDRGRFYLAMKYVEGGSLEDYLRNQGGRIRPEEVVDILTQMLEGLRYAHGEGIIHRDLKPANILRTAAGRIKISDFGLVRVVGEEFLQTMIRKSIALSQLGDQETQVAGSSGSESYVGTIDYMSPEVREGRPADERSDLYAVGVMGYYLLTGRKPLGRAKAIADLVPEASETWDAVIDRCMELERSERYGSAEEVLGDLRRIEIGPEKKGKSRAPVWATLSLILVAGLAAGYYWGVYLPGKEGEEKRPEAIRIVREERGGEEQGEGVPAFGSLLVNTLPDSEIFLVDRSPDGRIAEPGTLLGKSDVNGLFELKDGMAVGNRMILVRKKDFRDSGIAEIVIEENRLVVVEVGLQPLPGSLVILSSPSGAEVEIDGVRAGVTPYTAGEQEPLKKYRVVLSASGYRDYVEAFELKAREDKRLSVTLEKAAGSLRIRDTAAEEVSGPVEGEPWTVPDLGLKMVWINPGTFMMGSPARESGRGSDETLCTR